MNKIIAALIFAVSLSIGSLVQAQDSGTSDLEGKSADTTPYAKRKKVKVNFEDQLVQGGVSHPEVEYIFEKKQFNYRKLIKLRENFIPEAQAGKEEFGAGD